MSLSGIILVNIPILPISCISRKYRGGSRIPCRRGRQPSRRRRQSTILLKFSKKLHEIEKILGCRGVGAHLGHPPLNLPLKYIVFYLHMRTIDCQQCTHFEDQQDLEHIPARSFSLSCALCVGGGRVGGRPK